MTQLSLRENIENAGGRAALLEYGDGGSVKVRDVIKQIEADGWRLASQKGSHRQYKHPIRLGKVTIAGHPSMDTAPKTRVVS